ncbi:hypothetical protein OG729_00645 [Streptomyces sp. NBC_00210]|uniref:hypothetical protein n=1 Tax=Streptomyces sp. NBC_00210 TaxID=2903636 RepID=UPI003247D5AE
MPGSHRLVQGAVVAVAELADYHPDDGSCTPWSSAGSHHWVIRNVQPLPTPIRASGNRSLWTPGWRLLEQIAAVAPGLRSRLAL